MALEKTLRNIAVWAVFAVPFVVLIIANGFFFPFITGKNFAFRILVEIAVGAWLPLALAYPAYRPRRSWILAALTLFVLSIGISDVLGVYLAKSIWSNFERMEGWVTLVHLFGYFIVATSVLTTEKLWRRFFITTLIVSSIVALRGLLQLAGFLTINQGGVRLDSFLGNATYLAIYMVFHIGIAALLWSRSWIERTNERVIVSMLYGASILLNAIILFFTATRGALLGLLGGVLLAGVLYAARDVSSAGARRVAALLGILILISGGLWALRDSSLVRSIGPLARLTSISFGEASLSARFMNIGMAWQGFSERPLLGWGQENYAVVFDKYYNPNMYASEPWFDRVHNVVFDWMIAGGILGLLLYLSLYVSALVALWRGAFSHVERSIVTGLLAAYFFYLLFTFDNITSYILFFSVLAWIHVRASAERPALLSWKAPAVFVPIYALGAVLLVWGSVYFVNASAITANKALLSGLSAQSIGEGRDAFLKAISYGMPASQEAREHFLQSAGALQGANAPEEMKLQYARTALEEMAKQMTENPLSARFPFFYGALLNAYGQYADAKSALLHAHELSPGKQAILFELGRSALAQGNITEALEWFKKAYDAAPSYVEARALYAAALIFAGQDAQAEALITPLIEAGGLDNRIAAAYASIKRYDKIAEIWSAYVEKHPSDIRAHFTLAIAYYASGNVSRATGLLEEAARTFPSASQEALQVAAQMKAGTFVIQ